MLIGARNALFMVSARAVGFGKSPWSILRRTDIVCLPHSIWPSMTCVAGSHCFAGGGNWHRPPSGKSSLSFAYHGFQLFVNPRGVVDSKYHLSGSSVSIPDLITVSKVFVFSSQKSFVPTRRSRSTSSRYFRIPRRFVVLRSLDFIMILFLYEIDHWLVQ